MPNERKLNKPWLVAVWPGMGHVAINAGYYLMAKLEMHLLAELSAEELFDVDHVEVKDGIIMAGHMPRSRFFVWRDPQGNHDIVVFIGEAQPPIGKYAFCRRLIQYAQDLGVERFFTFAAMATQMHPSKESQVFGAATDQDSLDELKRLDVEILDDGHIGGLNGVLLGAAAESQLRGACLLGEMPQVFAQLPFPKAALAVLEAFTALADIDIDLSELGEQSKEMEHRLGEVLSQMEHALGQQSGDDESDRPEGVEEEPQGLSAENKRKVERLFERARQDRSAAYELKRELDSLGAYREYENRFLDLFKKPESS